eukprot:5562922-Prymnesium_polylepis.1
MRTGPQKPNLLPLYSKQPLPRRRPDPRRSGPRRRARLSLLRRPDRQDTRKVLSALLTLHPRGEQRGG